MAKTTKSPAVQVIKRGRITTVRVDEEKLENRPMTAEEEKIIEEWLEDEVFETYEECRIALLSAEAMLTV